MGRIALVQEPVGQPVQEPAEAAEPPRLTVASLAVAAGACVAWYAVAITAFFAYAAARPADIPPDCRTCMTYREAALQLGYLGVLPAALVGLLASLVVITFAATRVRPAWLLGSLAALVGMALGACGLVTIFTFEP
jgi:hypothetical protein